METRLDKINAAADGQTETKGLLFEGIVSLACQMIPDPGDTVIDVGANRGAHTLTLAGRVGKKGTVHAFEPIPDMVRILRKRLRRAGLRQVKIHRRALSNQTGRVDFQYFRKLPAYSGLNPVHLPDTPENMEHEIIRVRQTRLDDHLPTNTRASLIKLDVEGGEFDAMRGAEALIGRSRPVLIFENGLMSHARRYGYSPQDFMGFFHRLDMRVFGITGYPVTRRTFQNPPRCWQFVALPVERKSEINRFKRWTDVILEEYRAGGRDHILNL